MIDFLSSEDFRFLWLPIFTTIMTILVKIFYKDRRMHLVSWNDFAVAPNLMVTAIFIFLIKLSLFALDLKMNPESAKNKMDTYFYKNIVFAWLIAGIVAVTWIMRETGWRQSKGKESKEDLRESEVDTLRIELKPTAIILSDIVGAFYIIVAYNY